MIYINITFNINEFNLLLSAFINKSNLNKTFYFAYYISTLEFGKVFIFIIQYINDLFFYNNSFGPSIIIRNFSLGLFIKVFRLTKEFQAKTKIQVA